MTTVLSLTFLSDSRMYGISVRAPSAFGTQWPGPMPCGKKIPTKRLLAGTAAVCASSVRAGTIASSNGSANAAPAPLRMVRRGMCRFVINISVLLVSRCLLILLQSALVPRQPASAPGFRRPSCSSGTRHSSRPPVRARRTGCSTAGLTGDGAHQRHVLVFHPAAERVGEHLLGRHLDERVASSCSPASCAAATGPSTFVPSNTVDVGSTGLPLSSVRHCAIPSKFSSANPIGSIMLWHWMQSARTRCDIIFIRIDGSFALPVESLSLRRQRRHVWRRIRRAHPEDVRHDPLAARHRRGSFGLGGRRQNGRLAEQAFPHIHVRAERDAPELAAVNIRDAVVLGQPLVDERVVRRQQVDDAAVLADDAVEQQLDFAPHGVAQRIVEVRIDARQRRIAPAGRAGSATGPRS